MEYIIGIILVIILFILYGLFARKKVYDRVDRLEEKKMDIMNRNVTDELSKIKDLNLSGETQARFEKWRTDWDHIVDRQLPDMEEELFDAEEAADRYRFRMARRILDEVERTLGDIEASIDEMFKDVEKLLNSEENSRKEVENLKPSLKEIRKKLLQNRHMFGKAETAFELEIDEIEEGLALCEELNENGDYIEANERVQDLHERIKTLKHNVERFPSLYKLCKQELPSTLDRLSFGLKEMKEKGFRIQKYGFEKEIHTFQEKLIALVEQLEKAEVDAVEIQLEEMEERTQEIFDQLEKEALAKQYVEKHLKSVSDQLSAEEEKWKQTKNDVTLLEETYQFEDPDYEKHVNLEKWLDELKKQADSIQKDLENEDQTYSSIRTNIESWLNQWEELHKQHQEFQERLKSLRRDEISSRDKLAGMKKELLQVKRKLQKSNIPGIPEYILDAIDHAGHAIEDANHRLEKQPLDMAEVQHSLNKAEKNVQTMKEQIDFLLEQAELAEYVIQYANRYRSQFPFLAAKLAEAENAFRSYEYEVALEQAVEGLEEVEPGAIKKLEKILQTTVHAN